MAWEPREWGQGIAMRELDEWALNPSQEEESDKDLVAIVAAMEDARAAEDAGDAEGAAEHIAGSRPIARRMGACPSRFEEYYYLPQSVVHSSAG